ncbi:MAG TPA: DUF1003 domain-containing protein [Candidatus Dormibacteraeota bacterium]|nr:DUF1003 domain-containing protein [Candidatus Dormibacteraeota bacterium]
MATNSSAVHSQRAPARIADERVGLNDAIAAAITGWVGSMWAVYAALAVVVAWMALATIGPLRPLDPYPFPFMLFLGNLVQLLLCFVILVGQRVLSRAADARAQQTYENTDAIFHQVEALQAHLDRHDELLSRGLSLLVSKAHPWIEQHQVEQPPRAADVAVDVNGRIGAWLTRRMGSMWAFYAAAALQISWMALATWGPLRLLDPYPFSFLVFLSSLVQLVFMLVIMVGQDVLGRAGDRRSEQTWLDAQAILYECGRMRARLTAHDRVIESLCYYTRTQVTERLARTIHESYVHKCLASGEAPLSRPALKRWDDLPQELKESNRDQALHIAEKLATIGCVMVPAYDEKITFQYRENEVLLLARMEHDRWMRERRRNNFVYGPKREGPFHPDLVPWEDLSAEARQKDVNAIRDIPDVLAEAGYQVIRIASMERQPA